MQLTPLETESVWTRAQQPANGVISAELNTLSSASVTGVKHLFGARNKESDEQEIIVVEQCGGIVGALAAGLWQALCRNETRRYKAADFSTCPNISGSDNKSSACIKKILIIRCRENKSAQTKTELYSSFSLHWTRKVHTKMHQKAQDYVYAILICCVGWKKTTCQILCIVKKNNSHSLIPLLATVTHTTDHGNSNMVTRVQIVLGLSATCSEAIARVIRRGLPWALMVNSRMVSRCPCVSRCMHWLRAYHIFLQSLPWEKCLRTSSTTNTAETKHFNQEIITEYI